MTSTEIAALVTAALAAPLWQGAVKAWERVQLRKHDDDHADCLRMVTHLSERVDKAEATIDTLLLRLVPSNHDTDPPPSPAE